MAVFNRNRKFGVEIEVATQRQARTLVTRINREFRNRGINQTVSFEGYTHQTMPIWKIVRDGSVRGWEIVSPPMKGLQGKIELEAVCKALSDLEVKVDRSTGLHIHHDAADLTGKEIGAVVTLYAANQKAINYLVSPSRRGRNYGSSLSYDIVTENGTDKFNGHGNERDEVRSKVIGRLGRFGSTRYNAVNLLALAHHGTIEFRQHQGSIDATKIWNWVLFTQSFMEASKETTKMPKETKGQQGNRSPFSVLRRAVKISPTDNNNHPDTKVYQDAFRFFSERYTRFCEMNRIDPNTLEVRA